MKKRDKHGGASASRQPDAALSKARSAGDQHIQREFYVLSLYVTGTTPQSMQAILNIKQVCEKYLEGRYDLKVIDIFQQPELARSEQIIAAPTLIKRLPKPLRKLIGNMSDLNRVLVGLDLEPI